jgi:hypothetical protein
MRLLRFRVSVLQAMIIVPVLGILTPCFFGFFVLVWFMVFGDVPWSRWSVPNAAIDHVALEDPKFRIKDYEVFTQWIGGRNGSWEVHFTHKVTRQRRCLRYVNTFPYGAFTEIDCPPVTARPGG